MYRIEVSEIAEVLNNTPPAMNVMFVGATGIGKTQCVERYCKDRGIYLKTLILSQLEASETLGIPIKSTREFRGKTYDILTEAIPEWAFDLAEHQDGTEDYPAGAMLFLDEFLCSQPSVMNAFLNFLTQKRVKDLDLSKVKIVAATNVGNYTFEPDTNMLSRFCWFYTVNTHVNEYLKDDRIINDYRDNSELEGVIFDVRSLSPRCQEWLMGVDDEHLQMFYEGFTNKKYVMVHRDPEINDVISTYFVPEGIRHFTITDEGIISMVAVLCKTFTRFRKWGKVISNFVNVDIETLEKIKRQIITVTGIEE